MLSRTMQELLSYKLLPHAIFFSVLIFEWLTAATGRCAELLT